MRKALIGLWLLLPLVGAAWHYGPGQQRLLLDRISSLLDEAENAIAEEIWDDAVGALEQALALVPDDRPTLARRIRLERAKVQMQCGQLPQAHRDLLALLDELAGDPAVPARLLRETRETLAGARFYMTWLMRLEGLPRQEWESEIEAARELYRLLAEEAVREGRQQAATRHQDDLEAAIRLARMDLQQLQGLPLPNQ